MKINFFVGGIFRSGGMRIIFEYANRLVMRGHDVVLYFPYWPYNFRKGESSVKDILKNYYWRIKDLLHYKKTLNSLYHRKFPIKGVLLLTNWFVRDADVSIATQWPTSFSLKKLSPVKGKKFYFIQAYEKWNANVKLVNESYKLDLHRITISEYLKKMLLEKFNSKTNLIYNGIDFSLFDNPVKNFKKANKTILYIDHFLDYKDIKTGIKTIERVKEKFPATEFICFGYQKYNNFPGYVKFIENPSDELIKELYSKSDIFLFNPLVEGFGLPPAEAMACKCAVVSTAVGAIPEYAEHMKTAILTDPMRPEELFDGICYLIENEDELKRISIEGFNKVREFFDWEKSVNKFEEVLEKSINS